MPTNSASQSVLLTRCHPTIQILARKFLEKDAGTVGLITAEDPLHLFFHNVDDEAIKALCGHLSAFLKATSSQRIVLAGGLRPDVLTSGEVHFKLKTAAAHLRDRFPDVEVDALFVNQEDNTVERVVLLK